MKRPSVNRLLRVPILVLLPLGVVGGLLGGCGILRSPSRPPDGAAAVERAELGPARDPDRSTDLPRWRSDAEAGRASYVDHCSRCHGEEGAGDGAIAGALEPPPPDWTAPETMAEESPAWFYRAVTRGVLGGSMPRFDTLLDEQERWDVAFYAWSRAQRASELERGARRYAVDCVECHGSGGDTLGDARLDRADLARRSRLELGAHLRDAHQDLVGALPTEEVEALVEYLFTLVYEPWPPDPVPRPEAR